MLLRYIVTSPLRVHAGGVRVFSRLLIEPDHPRWRYAHQHNDTVSRLINAAFREIGAGAHDPLAYARAHKLAAQCVDLPRSTHQNMLVSLALGLSLESMEQVDMASAAFYDALESARETHDFVASVELHDQLGATLRCQGRYEEAADFYEDGLVTLEDVGGVALTNDPITLHFEIGMAVSLMAIGDYDASLLHLPLARELARQAADAIALAGIDLTTANVHSARGDMHAALPLILAARDAYARAATPSQRTMQGRLHAIAAGALLDVAEVFSRRGHNAQQSIHVELAGDFAEQALNHAVETDELGARYLGLIALARYKRLSGRLPTTIHLLTPLLTDAERHDDPHLAIQVHTAIGQDYAAQGDWGHTFDHYRRAVHGASECGAIYLGAFAQRELIRGSQS
jgi:tetratricopeptide (TPR) repeat protein